MAKTVSEKIEVCRESFVSKKTGSLLFNYFVRGTIRGREVKASLNPADNGGFDLLEIIFDGGDKAELLVKPYAITDDKTGETISGNTYEVVCRDENGDVYLGCPVKPARPSDKAVLALIAR